MHLLTAKLAFQLAAHVLYDLVTIMAAQGSA